MTYSELSGKDDNTPPTFKLATLVLGKVMWTAVGVLHVYHESIVPGGVYTIRTMMDDQMGGEIFLGAQQITMGRWGDTVGQFDPGGEQWTAPNNEVTVTADVVAILDKFKNVSTAPLKARADIQPGKPDRKITILDVTRTLDAFSGVTYPFDPPSPCP